MPIVRPVSDLQRNIGSISTECKETKEPVYLTKNGAVSLVVIDAEIYDEQARVVADLREKEERIGRAISRGYDDLVNGRMRSWKQAKQDADRIREARNA